MRIDYYTTTRCLEPSRLPRFTLYMYYTRTTFADRIGRLDEISLTFLQDDHPLGQFLV